MLAAFLIVGADLGSAAPVHAASDVSAPQLRAFDVEPLVVDVSTAPATVTVRAHIEDDQAGTDAPLLQLSSQTTGQDAGFAEMTLVEGTSLDGWWEWAGTIPQGAAPGGWDVVLFPLVDALGNSGDFGPGPGHASVVTVINPGEADVQSPELIDLQLAPTTIDVAVAAQHVTARARIIDDNSGTVAPTMQLASQTTDQRAGFGPMTLASGTSLDGWWEWTGTIPQGAAPGSWQVVLFPLTDARGNAGEFGPPAHLQRTVTVLPGTDTTAPQVLEFSVSPNSLATSAVGARIQVRARITDDISGVQGPYVSVESPEIDGGQTGFAAPMRLTSGDARDGVWEWSGPIGHENMPGTWRVAIDEVVDERGNAQRPPAGASATVMSAIPPGLPSAPRMVTAEPGDGSATVTWEPPSSAGSSPITSYVVRAAPGGTVVSVPGDTRSATVAGLDNGRSYSFTVVAVNHAGSSSASNPASATPRTVPSAPTSVVATAFSSGARVSWTAPRSDGGAWITSYEVTASPGGATTQVWGPTPSTWIEGLSNGTAYTFTVVAVNAAGRSAPSASSAPVIPQGSPNPPTAVTATAGNGEASVSWAAPDWDGGAPITSYVVYSNQTGVVATVPASSTTALVTGLPNGVPHVFFVAAQNAVGTSNYSEGSAPVTPRTVPDAPHSVTAEPGDGQAVVVWTPGYDGGGEISSYLIAASPGGAIVNVPALPNQAWPLQAAFGGLTNGAVYSFTVTAVNAAGASPASLPSPSVTPRTVPDAPSNVESAAEDSAASVTWQAPHSDGGAPIESYTVTTTSTGASLTVGPEQTTVEIGGLSNGEEYEFTVTAQNAAGSSLASAPSPLVVPRSVPDPPTGVAVSPGFRQATVTWSGPTWNGGAPVTEYVVTAIPGGASVTVPAARTHAVVAGLTTGVEYRFTVVAVNEAGRSASSEPSQPVVPLPPLARLAGDSRYSTAAAISESFPVGVDTVYIASGLKFPDALTGAALAGSQDAPVLLTREREVPQATIDALVRLKPTNIVILGGTATVSEDVQRSLRAYGQVSRIAGSDRYDNGAAISRAFAPGVETVYVASGTNFPDALAGAGLAGSTGSPVLLTRQASLPDSVRAAIDRLEPERIVILGGPASVSEQVRGELARIATATRISGSDRYEVAAQISAQFGEVDHVYVASGQVFPDALAGAALAGAQGAPVLLVRSNEVPGATLAAIERLAPERITVLGGETTIDRQVEDQLRNVIR